MLSVMTKPLSTTPKFFLVLIFLVEFCFIEIAETKGSSSSGGSRRIHYNGGSGGGGFFGGNNDSSRQIKVGYIQRMSFFLPGAFGWIGYIVLLLQIFGLIVAILKCYLACTESSRRSCYLCLESDMSIEEWDKHRKEGQCPELFRYLGCEITPWVRCGKCNGPLRQLWL